MITLAVGILKGITKNTFSLIYHVVNLFLIAVGAVVMFFVFSCSLPHQPADVFQLITAAITIVVYQVAVYHESSLTNFLQQLSLEEWEIIFIHLCSSS